jgi:hypothetical protein
MIANQPDREQFLLTNAGGFRKDFPLEAIYRWNQLPEKS